MLHCTWHQKYLRQEVEWARSAQIVDSLTSTGLGTGRLALTRARSNVLCTVRRERLLVCLLRRPSSQGEPFFFSSGRAIWYSSGQAGISVLFNQNLAQTCLKRIYHLFLISWQLQLGVSMHFNWFEKFWPINQIIPRISRGNVTLTT